MIHETIWRRAYKIGNKEREMFWETARENETKDPEEMELLFVIEKSFYHNVLLQEFFAEGNSFYLLGGC